MCRMLPFVGRYKRLTQEENTRERWQRLPLGRGAEGGGVCRGGGLLLTPFQTFLYHVHV